MSSAVDRLAAQITRLERNVRALSTAPQLAYSSIEDGGGVNSNNADGTTMARYGGQFDGSFMAASYGGPTPPTPSAPIVTATTGGLIVRWDGTFTDADFAPMDFSRVEFQVSTVAGFSALSAATLVATVETPRGGLLFTPRAAGTYYVAFVARSLSGAAGPKSVTVGPITIASDGIDARLDAAEALLDVHWSNILSLTGRATADEATLASHTSELANHESRIDSAEGVNSSQGSTLNNHESRLDSVEGVNSSQGSTLSSHTSELANHEATLNLYGSTLSTHESKLGELNQRLIALGG